MNSEISGKIALVFPGQGSQYPGMGKALSEKFPEAREIFEQANAVLGRDIRSVIFSGSEEELKQTSVTQPAIFIASCAAFKVFMARAGDSLERWSFTAGHSLGEYSAHLAAESFDFQTALKLVEYRAKFIQECCEKNPGSMTAVIGMERTDLQALCSEVERDKGLCAMVNFNSPGQIVAAGTRTAMEALLARVTERPGCRGIPLNVSGAFHSTLMREASERMRQVLEPAAIERSKVPVLANVDAQASASAAQIKDKLARQIDHPVLWEDSVRKMIADGVETFIEIGPGKVLSGLLRKIDRKKKALNVEDEDSLLKTLNDLQAPAVK